MTLVSDIIGLKVLDKNGKIIGKVKDIELNMVSGQVFALVIGKGFFKHQIKILMEYVVRIEPHAVRLKISPITELEGRKVIDAKGNYIGKIKEVRTVSATNVLDSIVVRTKIAVSREISLPPIPGEKKPLSTMRVGIAGEVPVTGPSGEVDEAMPISNVKTISVDITIPSSDIEIFGKEIRLRKTKSELIVEQGL